MGALLLRYFTANYMGVERHVMAKAYYWELNHPMKAFVWAGIVLIALVLIGATIRRRVDLWQWLLGAGYVLLALLATPKTVLPYYYFLFALFVCFALESLRLFLLQVLRKKQGGGTVVAEPKSPGEDGD